MVAQAFKVSMLFSRCRLGHRRCKDPWGASPHRVSCHQLLAEDNHLRSGSSKHNPQGEMSPPGRGSPQHSPTTEGAPGHQISYSVSLERFLQHCQLFWEPCSNSAWLTEGTFRGEISSQLLSVVAHPRAEAGKGCNPLQSPLACR